MPPRRWRPPISRPVASDSVEPLRLVVCRRGCRRRARLPSDAASLAVPYLRGGHGLLEPLRPVVVAAGVGDDSEVAQRLRLAVAIPCLALDGRDS